MSKPQAHLLRIRHLTTTTNNPSWPETPFVFIRAMSMIAPSYRRFFPCGLIISWYMRAGFYDILGADAINEVSFLSVNH